MHTGTPSARLRPTGDVPVPLLTCQRLTSERHASGIKDPPPIVSKPPKKKRRAGGGGDDAAGQAPQSGGAPPEEEEEEDEDGVDLAPEEPVDELLANCVRMNSLFFAAERVCEFSEQLMHAMELDPETGATVWRMDCERDFGVFGVSCDGWNGQTFGMGAMDVSPDGTVVYFSPAPGMLMAAEVFLGPSEAPTLAPTEAPTAAAFAAAQQEQEKDSLAESGAASAVPAALATAAATALTALWIAA